MSWLWFGRRNCQNSLPETRESTSTKVCSLALVSGNFSLERLKSPPDPPSFQISATPYQDVCFRRTDEVEGLLSRLFEYHLRSCIPLVYKNLHRMGLYEMTPDHYPLSSFIIPSLLLNIPCPYPPVGAAGHHGPAADKSTRVN